MNAYELEMICSLDGEEMTETEIRKYFLNYDSAEAYAKEHGCDRKYGDIDSGRVMMVGVSAEDLYNTIYGVVKTSVTIRKVEIE